MQESVETERFARCSASTLRDREKCRLSVGMLRRVVAWRVVAFGSDAVVFTCCRRETIDRNEGRQRERVRARCLLCQAMKATICAMSVLPRSAHNERERVRCLRACACRIASQRQEGVIPTRP